jgi:hypothetical protein
LTEQLSLPGIETRAPVWSSRADELERQAAAFVAEHPEVWRLFVRFTFELIRSGKDHGGAKAIFERIRWESLVALHVEGRPVLNNNYTASFARAFGRTYPEHAAFFRTRGRPSEHRAARESKAA